MDFYSAAGAGLAAGIVAFAILVWRNTKRSIALSRGAQLTVFFVTLAASWIAFVLLIALSAASGFQSLDAFVQPLGIVSGVVGYFVGDRLSLRMARS